jgi:hypothetical protein
MRKKIRLTAMAPCKSKSISDDDLCANCTNCGYNSDEGSSCNKSWPGLINDGGYVLKCSDFVKVLNPGDNWV